MRKNPVLSMWKSFKKWRKKVPLLSHPKFLRIFVLLVIAAAIPFTVFVAQKQQDIRQRAAPPTNCSQCHRDYDNCTLQKDIDRTKCVQAATTRCQAAYASEPIDTDQISLVNECIRQDSINCEVTRQSNINSMCFNQRNTCLNSCVHSCAENGGTCIPGNEDCSGTTTSDYCGTGGYCCVVKQKIQPTNTPEASKPTATPATGSSNPPSSPRSGSGSGPGSSGGGGGASACPAPGDNCTYSENGNGGRGVCYSGHGAKEDGSFNGKGCTYSCGPIDCPTPTPSKGKSSSKKKIDCVVGEPQNECSTKCKNGGTCKKGHTFCEWTEDGNVESECVCNEDSTCSKDTASNSSCKDNPTSPPDGYTWKNSCKACSNNDDCPKNTKDGAVNPDTSNWCFSGKCLLLVSGSGSSSNKNNSGSSRSKDKDKNKNKNKNKDKKTGKDTSNLPGNGKGSKSGNVAKNLSNQSKNEKSARDKAQKPIDKLNKQLAKEGKPTLTPLPPDNGGGTGNGNGTSPTPTPSPTPPPPLPEPGNWQGTCGPTQLKDVMGIRVSWDTVSGASRYAVRIDEDAPSWEGDTPSPGDTVENNASGSAYVRVAKAGAVYQWWVHSVNVSGVYSALTKKQIIKCPQATSTTGTPAPQTVGAGQLIILPITTTPTPIPTTKPTATPTPKK